VKAKGINGGGRGETEPLETLPLRCFSATIYDNLLIPSWSGELFAGRKDKYEGLVTTSFGNILQIPLKSSINAQSQLSVRRRPLYTSPRFPFARGFERELFHT